MIVPVGVSKRHAHISREVALILFGSDKLPIRNNLKQLGQYASERTLNLKWDNNIIEHVRIVGPIRNYNQVELSKDAADYLGINPPTRKSGDLKDSSPIIIFNDEAEIKLKGGAILAQRYVHIDEKEALKEGFENGEIVNVYKENKFLFDAHIKIEPVSFTELHIDTSEEIIYDLHQDCEVEIRKCGK